MLQTFGLDHMGAYPFVRAAIIGHANKESPTNCRQVNNFVPPGKHFVLYNINIETVFFR